MLLVIDIGNTNTSIGVYKENELINTFHMSSDVKKTEDEYVLICENDVCCAVLCLVAQ